ncbi:MAG: hypothetical protein ACD_23C01006G0003 [uncultured bacterium]|nr:MAG: hypothetical protein ACD_23C01006G0003 [uncultured bacterium]
MRSVDAVGYDMDAFARHAIPTHMMGQHFRDRQYGICTTPCNALCPARESLQSQATAVL